MSNPNYSSLLAQIATRRESIATLEAELAGTLSSEARATKQAQLDVLEDQLEADINECYQFTEELTAAEKNLFNYVSTDYMEDTPGTTTSYVGIYYGNSGIIS
jgi:flagellar biosynthesis chaperone FliJ